MMFQAHLVLEVFKNMFFPKKAGCRIFQAGFRLAMPFLPYREPEIKSSVEELGDVFENENIKSLLVVTDEGIVKNGLIKPLEAVFLYQRNCFLIYNAVCYFIKLDT